LKGDVVDQRESTPPYVRFLAPVIRPFPDWDLFFIKSLRQRAVEELQLKPGSRVLDAGCGPGGTFPFLTAAVGPSGEVVGVEISPEASMNAQRRIETNHWKNVRLIVGDARTVQLDGLFDGLVMFAAPDVYASPEAIANLFAYLKPQAKVVVFGAKLSHHRLGALANPVLHMLMKLSFETTPALDDRPLATIESRVADVHLLEYLSGCMFLAWGSVTSSRKKGSSERHQS
jgi:SAM-dependent methyltransferase